MRDNIKTKFLIALAAAVLLTLTIVAGSTVVSGAAFTTFNPWVDE